MYRNNAAAFRTGVLRFLFCHKHFQAIFLNTFAVCHKACLISFVIAFFKIFYQLAGIIETLKAISQSLTPDTIFYFAFAAVFRFSLITAQAARSCFFMIAMLITDLAVHSTGLTVPSIFYCTYERSERENRVSLDAVYSQGQRGKSAGGIGHLFCQLAFPGLLNDQN